MKFIPILFSTPMVQAILDGRKSQTRRICIIQSEHERVTSLDGKEVKGWIAHPDADTWKGKFVKCPYGEPGDVLWVRETWFTDWKYDDVAPGNLPADAPFFYLQNLERGAEGRVRPSIHMPKAACRIWLQVKSVRVERIQQITQEDAKAEGVDSKDRAPHRPDGVNCPKFKDGRWEDCSYHGFFYLWIKINGGKSWAKNNWVWVIEFERLTEKPEGF